jgi:hypothetical protein
VRCRLAGLCVLVALFVTAAQAGAVQSRHFTLKIGDVFVVTRTDLACETQVGTKVLLKGQKLVSCFKVKGGTLAANSYVVALGADGRTVVGRVTARGNVGAAVFNRKPAALGSGAKQITAHAGDEFKLSGTDLTCVINNDVSGVYPTCFRFRANGGLPGSYAFAETEKFVAIVRFDSTGEKTKVVFKREYGQ